jgi:DNA-binding transcriptional ArsR family regulator
MNCRFTVVELLKRDPWRVLTTREICEQLLYSQQEVTRELHALREDGLVVTTRNINHRYWRWCGPPLDGQLADGRRP